MKKKESSSLDNWVKGIGKISSTLPNYIKIISICCLFLIIISFIPIKTLLAKDYKTEEYIKSWHVKEDETFTVLYTHSVQLTPVTETYIVKGEDIVLTDTFFYSLGAGLPATTPYKFRLKGEGLEIYDINLKFKDFIYRTGAVRANHKLIFEDREKNREYDFLDFSEPRTGVKFQIQKVSLLSYILKEGFN